MVTHANFVSKIVALKEVKLQNPTIFLGFPENSTVGLTTLKYVIETLNMHQFAHLSSPYVPPATVFVAGKLRHPFRFYSDDAGKFCIIQSDIPIDQDGYYEMSSVIVDWIQGISPKMVVNVDGIASTQISRSPRTFGLGDKASLALLKKNNIPLADSALITGLGGSILSECVVRKIPLMSLLTVTVPDLPDPTGVLSTIEIINTLFGAGIKTDPLKEAATRFHEEMRKILSDYVKVKSSKDKQLDSMYG